ncbi:MAG TPA: helix-turn-helix transcriptional regulator [Pirellulales bacterium]|jgi:transcriptional regulator with XRE-family HTH domain|nr:helix-turn-helix transcriptional regulator [Pirellulales bacterium]
MAKRRTKPMKVSDQIRGAIDTCGTSRYGIAKRTGVSQSTLSHFMSGRRGLSSKALDAVAEFLGLEVVRRGPKRS